MGFASEKNLVASLGTEVLEGRAVIVLALLIGRCRIEIANPEAQGLLDHRHGVLVLSLGS
jgi:hypothetical protein